MLPFFIEKNFAAECKNRPVDWRLQQVAVKERTYNKVMASGWTSGRSARGERPGWTSGPRMRRSGRGERHGTESEHR